MISAKDIKKLRVQTGAGMLDCKKALIEAEGDFEAAVDWLRQKGLAAAAKKSGRIASEGAVGAYIHAGGKIGVMVEVNAETDFVARTDEFKTLVRDTAMHIAASSPQWVSVDDVPKADLERERQVQRARVIDEGKPAQIADRIVDGRMRKYFEDIVLLEQVWFRDDSLKVKEVLSQAVGTIGENIKVRRFTRYVMGEGLEKRSDDFASEVAAQAGLS